VRPIGGWRTRRRRTTWFAAAAAVGLVLAGCIFAWRSVRRSEAAPALEHPHAALPLPVTTDGEIAVRNLDADVRSLEARVARAPADVGLRAALASLLLTRGDFLGTIGDYERSDDLAEDCVRRRPRDPNAYRTRASARSALHRFDDAWADLSRAESLGARPRSLAEARAGILAARGKLDEAVEAMPKDEATLDALGLASLGLLYLETGRSAEAARLLGLARARILDTSPLPFAWIDFHEGELAERFGDRARARALYARAEAVLPRYAAAGAHLAAYLSASESIPMLTRIAERSDNPEIDVALGAALRARGDPGAAHRVEADAAVRYDELTKRQPAAFADHAARFWLGPGDDPEKAFAWARANLESRQTSVAFDLALTAALASQRADDACDLAARGLALKYADDTFRTVATAIARRCPTPPALPRRVEE
jgi:tetratricopeptide (TPR) repeat protein